MKYEFERREVAKICKIMFQRRITDISGGNVSVRVDDHICITPRFAGSHFLWDLAPEQILILDMKGSKLEGDGEPSRECLAHIQLLNEFPDGKAVVHGHAQNILTFCSLRMEMPPVLENTLKFGITPVCEYAPAGSFSKELAEYVASAFKGREELVRKYAAAVIAPFHGLFVLGNSLLSAIDSAERLDLNARVILSAGLIGSGISVVGQISTNLLETASSFE